MVRKTSESTEHRTNARPRNEDRPCQERIAMEEQGVVKDVIAGGAGEPVSVQTLRFGEVTITESRVLTFPRGIVGMPDARRFTFLHIEESDGPFFWMQSLDDPALAFVVCEPQSFFPDYSVSLTQNEQEDLGIKEESDGLVCVILVVPEDPQQITANLRGPVVVNTTLRRGYQLVMAGDDYPAAAPLFEESMEGGATCSS